MIEHMWCAIFFQSFNILHLRDQFKDKQLKEGEKKFYLDQTIERKVPIFVKYVQAQYSVVERTNPMLHTGDTSQ
jgi:hypothetical protein